MNAELKLICILMSDRILKNFMTERVRITSLINSILVKLIDSSIK